MILSRMKALLGRKKELRELQARFQPSVLPESIPSSSTYPLRTFLGEQGIYAYLIQIHVPTRDMEAVRDLVGTVFPRLDFAIDRQIDVRNDDGESVQLMAWREFNGIRFDLITNSSRLLKLFEEQPVAPPPPWEAFPRLDDPTTLGSLQGDVEYWWSYCWSPYWDCRTDQQRNAYLTAVGASKEWIECIEVHHRNLRPEN